MEEFFEWLEAELESRVLLPTNSFTKAAHYALSRRKELKVFLEHPGVPLDTNHLERQIRSIAVGRKNWLFCWTELGAEYVGVLQSLLQTCRLQGLSPYHYLVDVLQRVDSPPASEVALLTPRLWKERFGGDPLLSPLETHTGRTAD
ncbi:MAG: transposase [Acidobacteriota bacterium]|nr:transposase [Acidobacteriota bacterium]